MFMKDESYEKYKYMRLINSRTDAFKVRVGPIFKLIEKELFSMDWFIKHTPVDLRSREILRELTQDGAKIVGTDYTSFEALFTKDLMEACEMQLYEYMSRDLPDYEWYQIVYRTLTGRNLCCNKFFDVSLEATRMSGEMCTSLGNSFTNLMVFLYVANKNGLTSVKGRVEGDDGIFSFYGPYPNEQDFTKLGLIIKIDKYDEITEASFCGIIADAEELIQVRDPISALLDFGYTTRQYAYASDKRLKQLLRAKAMSLIYQYPGCPILDSLARMALKLTTGSRFLLPSHTSEYHKDIFYALYHRYGNKFPVVNTGLRTRRLVEKKFGISIMEQLQIEQYLDSIETIQPLFHPAIIRHAHPDTIDYFERYAHLRSAGDVPCYGVNYRLEKHKFAFQLFPNAFK